MTVALVIFSTVASKITMRVGPKRLLIGGMTALAIGLAWLSDIGPHGDYLGEMLAAQPADLDRDAVRLHPADDLRHHRREAAGGRPGLGRGQHRAAVRRRARAGGPGDDRDLAHATPCCSHPTAAIHTANQALVSGFQLAFWVAAGVAAVGVLVAVFGMPNPRPKAAVETQAAVAVEI